MYNSIHNMPEEGQLIPSNGTVYVGIELSLIVD